MTSTQQPRSHWSRSFILSIRQLLTEDFGELPIYVRYPSELPGDMRREFIVTNGLAWTHRCCDVWLHKHLVEAGEWHGRGFATIVADRIQSVFDDVYELQGDVPLLAVLLHEATHFLQYSHDRFKGIDPTWFEGTWLGSAAAYNAAVAEDAPSQTPANQPVPWLCHGPDWARALAHVHHRVQRKCRSNCSLPELLLFTHADKGLAPLQDYFGELGDEPAQNIGRPIADVLAEPAPQRFTEFADSDVERATQALRAATAATEAAA